MSELLLALPGSLLVGVLAFVAWLETEGTDG